MKKIKKLFAVFIIMLILCSSIKVNAEEIKTTSLPKEYTNGNFTYSIESFEIRAYDASKDAEGNSKMFTDRTVLWEVPLSGDEFTINPEPKESKIDTTPGMFVNLNLSIDEAKFKEIVKSKITSMNNNDAYYFELVVNYKFTKLPTNYKYYNHISIIELIIAMVSDNANPLTKVSLNESTSQVINIASYIKENDTETFTFDEVSSKEESDITSSAAILDYVIASNEEDIIQSEENQNTDAYIFMFHNLDNIEEIISSYQDIFDELEEKTIDVSDSNKTQQGQVVKVEDTFKTAYIGYIIGIFVLIVGILVIIKTYRKSKSERT